MGPGQGAWHCRAVAGASADIGLALSLAGDRYGENSGGAIAGQRPDKSALPSRARALLLARAGLLDQARAILQHSALASAFRIKKRDWWGEPQ